MEFEKDNTYVTGRLKSVKFAVRGAVKLLSTEHSVMTQFLFAVFMIGAGFYFDISATEWMFQIMATGLVLAVEGLNTAMEKIADFIHPGYNEKIGLIKDISAGAVLFAAMAAFAVGLIIYIPKIINV